MKNLIIAGVVGLVFMAGGFFVGMKLVPVPPPPAKVAAVKAVDSTNPLQGPISMDALRKASQSMMNLNDSLRAREQNVAAREERAKQKEDELVAERAALNRAHEKFKELYLEFQQRLQLVDANETDRLQKEASLFLTMDSAQAIDLLRAMDDSGIIRIFSVMDVKPLGRLVSDWKAKYPNDTPRLLNALDGMSQVMPKDKIAIADPITPADTAAPTDTSTPTTSAPATDSTTPDTTTAPAADPNASTTTPAPTDSTASTPPADSTTSTAPPADPNASATPPADPNASTTPPADSNSSMAPPADPAATPQTPPADPPSDPSSTPAPASPAPAPATTTTPDPNSAPVSTAATN
jgi:hypothetical protein